MVKIKFNIDPRIKKYLKENFESPFIIGFMILLVLCAIFLSLGYSTQADKTAEYAYYLLVLGVILQLVQIVKEDEVKLETCS